MRRIPRGLCVFALLAMAPAGTAQCLSTLIGNNNSGSVGGAVYFDIAVTNGVRITTIDTNYSAAVSTPVGMDVYTTPGTSVGVQANMAAWTLVATDDGTATAAGLNVATTITLASPLIMTPGSFGVALVAKGSGHAYTNGTGANQNYSNADIALALGSALNVPFTGTPFSPRVWNGAICYTPAQGLFPNFDAAPRKGSSPMLVQFTDMTYTSDPGGVQTWVWDVDGDGIPDYNSQNPQHTYTMGGRYNVTLSVTDLTHPPAMTTKMNFIEVDILEASFTSTLLTGRTFQFTDTSIGNPAAWAWDFDNDGTIDSTAPNPIHTYPMPGVYTCALMVTNAFSTDTVRRDIGVDVIPMPAYGRTFSSATTRGYWFQAPTRFSMVGLKVPDETAHGMQNVCVYNLGGAPPAFPGTIAGQLLFSSFGTSSAQQIPCIVSFETGDYVGVLGACGDATTMRNSYATPVGPIPSSVLGQPITLTRLLTQTNIVVAAGTGLISEEAAFEVSRVEVAVSPAVGLSYGTGTASGAGPAAPALSTTALPLLGQNAELSVDQQDANALGFLVFGLSRANIPTPFGTVLLNPLPVSTIMNGGAPLSVGQNLVQLPVPANPVLNGARLTIQNINIVPGSPNGASLSNGHEWQLAN